jgi:phenylacetate-CoA ligase
VPSGIDSDRATIALVAHLQTTQWASTESLTVAQRQQLVQQAAFACKASPLFAKRMARGGLEPSDLSCPEGIAALPVLTRREIQSSGDEFFCTTVPPGHGRVFETHTSGSTGEPVVVRRTGVSELFWRAMAMRELQWHERNLSGRLCAIRANVPAAIDHDSWGPPASLFAPTGPLRILPIGLDVPELVAEIEAFGPTVLVVYPGTLAAIVAWCDERGRTFEDLQHILTIGESLPRAVRGHAEAVLDASVADTYTSEEVGYIASECPVSGRYHVMAESVLAEVLDENGHPCRPGDVGRVVVTDLHNFATPLIRYDIGDYAEVGHPCECGRGLPTWTRIVGRSRNLLRLPDGRRYWPRIGLLRSRSIAPVQQFQVIQDSLSTVEAKLVVERRLTASEEDGLRALIVESLGHRFDVRFTYVQGRIPAGPTGKYEEFVCRVA